MTCVLVTHEMGFARRAADTVYFTEGGRIIAAVEGRRQGAAVVLVDENPVPAEMIGDDIP